MAPQPIERRRQPRTQLSQVVRIRPFDAELPAEYCTTLDVSQDGLYFSTLASHYVPGVNVYVSSDYHPGSPLNHVLTGLVVRVDKLDDERYGVAVQVF